MKVPDSGMPEETYWESLVDVPLILDRLNLDRAINDAAELGCGYGTFSIPTARRISGTLFSHDIENAMLERTAARARSADVKNLRLIERDVLAEGFDLPDHSVDAVLLFNILHFQDPRFLFTETARILRPSGRALIIHWRSDLKTPRGPTLDARPRHLQIVRWATAAKLTAGAEIILPPWHFGVVAQHNQALEEHLTSSRGALRS